LTTLSLIAATPAVAEKSIELIDESRAHLFFTAPAEEAKALLPPGWELAPIPGGPAEGANVLLVLIERVLGTDAEGAPLDEVGSRAVLIVFGRDPATGDGGAVVVDGVSDASAGVPGAYGAMVEGDITLVRTVTTNADSAPQIEELWTIEGPDGDEGEVRLAFQRGAIERQNMDVKVWSAREPGFYRIYRTSQGVAVVRSVPMSIGDDTAVSARFSGPRLGALLDSDTTLVAAWHLPWYRRETLLP
jgi:hypothetical protein